MTWHANDDPEHPAPKDGTPDDITGLPCQVLLGCFHRGQLMWAMAASYQTAMYGYIQCASRSGWSADYMPKMADGANRPRHPGNWIMGEDILAPTHWMSLPPPPKDEGK